MSLYMASRPAPSSRGPPGVPPAKLPSAPPNNTLYVSNLNDKLRKQDLRRHLYMLFTTYGSVLDVVALKTEKMRGQAHITFRDIPAAHQAMLACQRMEFFGKPMTIQFAKTEGDILKKLRGTYNAPTKPTSGSAAKETEAMSDLQKSIFDRGAANDVPRPSLGLPPKPNLAPPTPEPTHGVKRAREEEPAEEDEEVPMEEDSAMEESDDE